MPEMPRTPIGRLAVTIEHATGLQPDETAFDQIPLTDPARLTEAIRAQADGFEVVVTGTLDRRLVLIEHRLQQDGPAGAATTWTAADLSGRPHRTRAWPTWTAERLTIGDPDGWLSAARVTAEGAARLLSPKLLLVALYHPEYFPLPRFPLGISDLARAARATLLGQVELIDMQLGSALDDVLDSIAATEPDIVGVSATFGQHDLMAVLLDQLTACQDAPMVVAGGSLTARNERLLLERYPRLLVARGAGEPTVQDVLALWHGDLAIDQVRGLGYHGAPPARPAAVGAAVLQIGPVRRTATVANRLQTDIWPELDLLPETFRRGGVAQLESSRGCTNFCSFCPRGHKGAWAGTDPDDLAWILHAYREDVVRLDRTPLTIGQLDPPAQVHPAVAAEDHELEHRRDHRTVDVDDRLRGVAPFDRLPVGLGPHVTHPRLPDVGAGTLVDRQAAQRSHRPAAGQKHDRGSDIRPN
jgi:hypothetical protein